MAKKQTASKSATKSAKTAPSTRKKAAKRELVDTGRDKRYVRRDEDGQFQESDDVGKSLAQDRLRKAKTVAKPGQGDKGDQKKNN